ncbi:hypothetical protein HanIR_Chr09g0442541 [Helianthus annuus]|nr:hypothetical protein HanIR_Chr09g0442541 [Helianthus annuus]
MNILNSNTNPNLTQPIHKLLPIIPHNLSLSSNRTNPFIPIKSCFSTLGPPETPLSQSETSPSSSTTECSRHRLLCFRNSTKLLLLQRRYALSDDPPINVTLYKVYLTY